MIKLSHLSLIAALSMASICAPALADDDVLPTASQISLVEAVKKAEAQGYRDCYKVKFEKNIYEIKALNKAGKKIKLKVDANTGTITEER